MENDRMLTVPQVAERLGVTREWVRRRIVRGDIPARKVGNMWVIRERDLAAIPPSRPVGKPRINPDRLVRPERYKRAPPKPKGGKAEKE